MRALAILWILVLWVSTPMVAVAEVLVLEEIQVHDTSMACGASTLPAYLPIGGYKLTRDCNINESEYWYQVGLTLEISYPFLINTEDEHHGEFIADAFGSYLYYKLSLYTKPSAGLQLEAKADVWDFTPEYKEKKTTSKVGSGTEINEAALHLNISQEFQNSWLWDYDEFTFEFDVNAGAGSAQPGFYLWFKYRPQSGGPYSLFTPKTGSRSGKVTSTPAGIDCGDDCSESYSSGTQVTLTATADQGATFLGWDGGGCSGTGTCTVTMDQPLVVAANFKGPDLNVHKAGSGSGTVTSTPAGINCGDDCSETYTSGTEVTLVAHADAISEFTGWSGGGCAGTGTCTVTMNDNIDVTAEFRNKLRNYNPWLYLLLPD
jgi:hypothetical protein